MRFNVCSEGMRVRRDVCRAVLITSLVWMMIDVVVLFYFIDPGLSTYVSSLLFVNIGNAVPARGLQAGSLK